MPVERPGSCLRGRRSTRASERARPGTSSLGMPEPDVEVAARQAVSPLRARVENGITSVQQVRRSMSASAGESPENRRTFARARAELIAEVLGLFARLRRADPISDPAITDRVAEEVRMLSVTAFNILDDWDAAYLLTRVAMEIARTPPTLAAIARDQATVALAYHQHQANQETAAGGTALAAAHFELAADFATEDEERQHLLRLAGSVDPRRSSPWQSCHSLNRRSQTTSSISLRRFRVKSSSRPPGLEAT